MEYRNHLSIARKFLVLACTLGMVLWMLPLAPAMAAPDVTAPVLTGFDFNPKTVDITGGDAAFTLTASGTDDLSGIHHINVTFRDPAGGDITEIIYDPGNRISGDALNGTYEDTETIEQNSIPGTWTLHGIQIYDELSNNTSYDTAYLAAAGYPTELVVTGPPPDVTAPVLTGFDFNPKTVDITGGDAAFTLTASGTDDLSGISHINVTFRDPAGGDITEIIYDPGNRISGDALNGTYEDTETIEQYSIPGTWTLHGIQIYDELSNNTSYDTAYLAAAGYPTELVVTGPPPDVTAPVLTGFDFNPKTVDITGGDAAFTLTASGTDDLSGISHINVTFRDPAGGDITEIIYDPGNRISGDALNGTYEDTETIEQYSIPGTWTLHGIQIYDELSNNTSYDTAYLAAAGFPTELVVNSPPVANDDAGYTTYVDDPLDIQLDELLANDTDADGDPLVITDLAATPDTHGTVEFWPTLLPSVMIDFSWFPGTDNLLGTGDDVDTTPGIPSGDTVIITPDPSHSFANLNDHTGVVFESMSFPGYGGSIIFQAGDHRLVSDVDGVDGGPTSYSYADVRMRFVEPGCDTCPRNVAIATPTFIELGGGDVTVEFRDAAGSVLYSETVPNAAHGGAPYPVTFDDSADGSRIAMVDVDTTFSVATTSLEFTPVDFDFVRYTPDPGYVGPAEFEYTVEDPWAFDVGLVSITVQPILETTFNVDPHGEHVWGHHWTPNHSVDISVNGVVVDTQPTDGGGNFGGAPFDPAVLDIVPSNLVEVSDGTTLKSHTVTELVITGVDAIADTISGTTDSSFDVFVEVRNVLDTWRSEGGGAGWLADFSVPGGEPGEEVIHDLVAGDHGIAAQCDTEGDCTYDHWNIPNPHFNVDPQSEGVWGHEWPPDASVEVFVNGASVATPPTDSNGDFGTQFDPAVLNIEAGNVVEVTDGVTTKTHTVTNLAVTDADPATDIVSGTADIGTDVDVWTHDESGAWRHEVAGGGVWAANFGTPGGEEGEEAISDLVPGSNGNSAQCDPDGDCTFAGWQIPDPRFAVDPESENVWGNGWTPNASVDITVDGTPVGSPPTDGNGDFNTQFDPAVLDIGPGDVVVVTDGTALKELLVTGLFIDAIDPVVDTISGGTDSFFDVFVELHNVGGVWRNEPGDGPWLANFAVPGDEEGEDPYDLQPGDHGSVQQYDDDGDETRIHWQIPRPHFNVDPQSEGVWGHEWPPDASVEVFVNGASVATPPTDSNGDFGTQFDPAVLNIEAGNVVEVTDGVTTKTHTVTNLAVTDADPATDIVSGTADIGTDVDVWTHDESGAWRHEVAGGGVWAANFGTPGGEEGEEAISDLVPGSNGNSAQCDPDGDCTFAGWQIPDPRFAVDPESENVWGNGWTPNASVDITVDGTPVGSPPTDGNGDFNTQFDPAVLDIGPGDVVVVTDGTALKELLVTGLFIDAIDPVVDTISGGTDSFFDVFVELHNVGGVWRNEPGDGPWLANFAVPGDEEGEDPYDLQPGDHGSVQQYDDDGDETRIHWNVRFTTFDVCMNCQSIGGNGWLPDDALTITFDDDDIYGNGVLLEIATVADGNGDFQVDLGFYGFSPLPDQFVKVVGSGDEKTTWLTNVEVTEVEIATDIVRGIAAPGSEVTVRIYGAVESWIWEHLTFQFGPGRLVRNPDSWNEYLEFRQAVAHAIDKDALVAAIPGAMTAIDSHVDAFVPAVSLGAWSQYPYDPTAAAGIVDALCTSLGQDCVANPPVAVFTTTANNSDRVLMASLLQPMLAAAGIDMVIDLEDSSLFFGGTLDTGTWDMGEWAWLGNNSLATLQAWYGSVDPDDPLQNFYHWGTPDSSVVNPDTVRMDELIDLMPGAADEAELIGYLQEAELILADGATFIPLYLRNGPDYNDGVRVVTADGDGIWEADFSVPQDTEPPVDIVGGAQGNASQYDDDTDATVWEWQVPSPHFNVDPQSEGVWGHEWPPDAFVEVFVNGASVATPPTDSNGDFGTQFDPAVLNIEAGNVVEVTDGVTTKTHTVTNLAVTDADPATDIVSGTADIGTDVDVWTHDESGVWRHEVAGGGVWAANFGTPGGEEGEEAISDLVPGSNGNSAQCDPDGDCTFAGWQIPDPRFAVDPESENVWGNGWTPNASVDITVDGTPVGSPPTDGNGDFNTQFDPAVLDIGPGDVVVVTDGTALKELLVTGLFIDAIDPVVDTISGGTDSFFDVFVELHNVGGVWRNEPGDGPWLANFAVPGDEEGEDPYDLQPGDHGSVQQYDDDGDETRIHWQIPRPHFNVDPQSEGVWGHEWPPDASVEVFVNGASVATPPTDSNGDFGTQFDPAVLNIEATDLVEVTDGVTLKQLIVTGLAVTGADPDTDTVFGTAEPGSDVGANPHGDHNVWRHEVADGDGEWAANFGTPGGEEGEEATYDLQPGDTGASYQCDDDNDCSYAHWSIANPVFTVDPESENVWGNGWTPDASVDITVNGVLVDSPPTDSNGDFNTQFDPAVLNIIPGDVVEVVDASSLLEGAIVGWPESVGIFNFDDYVGATTEMHVAWSTANTPTTRGHFYDSWVTNDDTWIAKASGVSDVTQITDASVYTYMERVVNNVYVGEFVVVHNTVTGYYGALRVDAYRSEGGTTVLDATWYVPPDGGADFSPLRKELLVTGLTIDGVDPDADTVSGVTDSFFDVFVEIHDIGIGVWRNEPGGGGWVADFSTPGDEEGEDPTWDLQPGTHGSAQQYDDDGDETRIHWNVPNPYFMVGPDHEGVWGHEWLPDTFVTISVNGAVVDTVPTDSDGNFGTGFDPEVLDIIPDDLVEVNDGVTFKAHTVTGLAIDGVDEAADTVLGTTDSFFDVFVVIYDIGEDVWRNEPGSGPWVADFSVAGDEEGEEPTWDVSPGVHGVAIQTDEDGDGTHLEWYVAAMVEGHVLLDGFPLPYVEVWVSPDHLTCTDGSGYFGFDDVEPWSEIAATGQGGPDLGCANAEFLDFSGRPLLTVFAPALDLFDGYEYVEFNVERAGAYQYVTVESHDGSDWQPIDGVLVQAWDRNDPDFVAAFGPDPDPSLYEDIWASGLPAVAGWYTWDSPSSGPGSQDLRYGAPTDVLILAELHNDYGRFLLSSTTDIPDYVDRGDGVLAAPHLTLRPPTISVVGDVEVVEGDAGYVWAKVWFELSTPALEPVRTLATTVDDTATGGDDYQHRTLWVSYSPGQTLVERWFRVYGDTEVEPDETFFVELSNPQGIAIGDGEAIITILNDDLPTLSVGNVEIVEGNLGYSWAKVPIELSAAEDEPVTVEFTTGGGTATPMVDYRPRSGTATFEPGDTLVWRWIRVYGDSDLEPDETFHVTLSAPSGALIGDGVGVVIILNDDLPVVTPVADVEIVEGDAGYRWAKVWFELSAPFSDPVRVLSRTADGIATGGIDYQSRATWIIFSPGQTLAQGWFRVYGDNEVEGDETFFIELSRPQGLTIGDAEAIVTILNDDQAGISVGDIEIIEANVGFGWAKVPIELSQSSDEPVTVHFATGGGTATAGVDYRSRVGTATFEPGETLVTRWMRVYGDTEIELDETFLVVLSAPEGAVIGDGTGVVTILNDDLPVVTPVGDVAVMEGDAGYVWAKVWFELSAPALEPVRVLAETVNGTATAGIDYQPRVTWVTFNPGQTLVQAWFRVYGDIDVEYIETFFVELSRPYGVIIGDPRATITIRNDDFWGPV